LGDWPDYNSSHTEKLRHLPNQLASSSPYATGVGGTALAVLAPSGRKDEYAEAIIATVCRRSGPVSVR
jgi:subtilase family serine protease